MKYNVVPRLGDILKSRGITQTKLAEITGIPQGTISKFDRNKQHQDVHLVAIARALNLKLEDLFIIEEVINNEINTEAEVINEQESISYEPSDKQSGLILSTVGSGKSYLLKNSYMAAETKGQYTANNHPSEQEEAREDLVTQYNKNQTEQDKNNK